MPQAELKAQNFYPIKSDEYTTDFLQLTTTQAGCLFKLRTAYFFSKNPLSPEQVAYLCPAVTEQDQQAREFVLSKYFTFSGGFYHSELMEEKIYLAKQEQEILEAEEKARKIRSEKARKKAMSRWGTIEKEMPQHVLQHKNENATAYATAYAPAHATASLLPGKSSETPEHQAVSGDSKNSEKTVQSTSHAYAHARTDPMSDIRSVCINNLINNKQHRSVSVSGSGSDLENTVRDLFNRENTPWTVDEVLQTMTFSDSTQKVSNVGENEVRKTKRQLLNWPKRACRGLILRPLLRFLLAASRPRTRRASRFHRLLPLSSNRCKESFRQSGTANLLLKQRSPKMKPSPQRLRTRTM